MATPFKGVTRAGYYAPSYGPMGQRGGTISITGIARTKRRVDSLAKADKQALRRGMAKAGRYLLRESKLLVPVKTGKLKSSGSSKVLNNSDKKPEYIVSYKKKYAIYVHEDLTKFHPNGQAKFLEQPARQHRKTLINIIEKEVKAATGKGSGIASRALDKIGI
jgi:hypothetical protein